MCEEDPIIPTRRRKNGWEQPPHYQQIIGWSAVFLFLFFYYGILIHSLLLNGRIAAGLIFGICLIVHVAAYIISTSIDPAPKNVRKIAYDTPVAQFDRSKKKHVIQDYFCSLCKVHADIRTKHCRSCNKCIKDFDHHCKWLNNCVGSRNYRAFIICIAAGLIGTLIVFITGMFEVIAYFTCKTCLQPYLDQQIVIEEAKRKNETYNPNYLPVFVAAPDYVWLGVVITIVILSLIPIVLLSQLLMLHAIFYFKHISSYEYILQLRKKAEIAQEKSDLGKESEKPSTGGKFGRTKLKHSITPEGFSGNAKSSRDSVSKQSPRSVNV